jgi:hypothetical protein
VAYKILKRFLNLAQTQTFLQSLFEGAFKITSSSIYNDSIYAIGFFQDSVDIDPDTTRFMKYFTRTNAGGGTMFYVILDKNGNFISGNAITSPQVGTYLDRGRMKVGSKGSMHIVGIFSGSVDFDSHPPNSSLISSNATLCGTDYFYLKLKPNLDFDYVRNWPNFSSCGGSPTLFTKTMECIGV